MPPSQPVTEPLRPLLVRQLEAFLRAGPYEPLVSREQVIAEVECTVCRAQPGQECDGSFPHPLFAAGMVLTGMSGVHLSRYQDLAHDPR